MRILVAGATGHTGERLVRRLLRAGHAVRMLSRRGTEDPVVAALVRCGAEARRGDCGRRWSLWEALEGCDALWSCSHVRYAPICLQACRTVGVDRYLQMSSTRRYTRFPCPSSREVIAGEEAIEASPLAWTILRATMIFGGARDGNVTRLMQWFRRRRWHPVFAGGTALVQPVYVEDLLDGMIAAFENPVGQRRAWTFAGREPMAHRRMLHETAAAVGVQKPVLVPLPLGPAVLAARLAAPLLARRGLTPDQFQRLAEDKAADIAPARELLGYAPRSYAEAVALKAAGGAEVKAIYGES